MAIWERVMAMSRVCTRIMAQRRGQRVDDLIGSPRIALDGFEFRVEPDTVDDFAEAIH